MIVTQLSESTGSVSLPLCAIPCFPWPRHQTEGMGNLQLTPFLLKNRVNEEAKLSTQQYLKLITSGSPFSSTKEHECFTCLPYDPAYIIIQSCFFLAY